MKILLQSHGTGNGPSTSCNIPLLLHTYIYTHTSTQIRMGKMLPFLRLCSVSRPLMLSVCLSLLLSFARLFICSCHILLHPKKIVHYSLLFFRFVAGFFPIHQICHITVLIIHCARVCVCAAHIPEGTQITRIHC